MPDPMSRDRDLVLPPNTFAYVLDSTKGKVSVYVGPYRNSLSNTDQLVNWDPVLKRFLPVDSVDKAIQVFVKADEGQYIVLTDPAIRRGSDNGTGHPPIGTSTESAELNTGRKVIIPGPATFPLWPGQDASPIDGHHLRHNQYLVVQVYNPDEAVRNWDSAVVAPQQTTMSQAAAGDESETSPDETTSAAALIGNAAQRQFTMGQLIIIKGTDVSFYMPSTGVEVVPEMLPGGRQGYVREAATLERLEYCILLDENGEKRYVQGPAVVFPEPTETFVDDRSNRKFLAIELNEQSGLYVKVIAPYEEDGVMHEVGEELFITGSEQAIYFPRPEHSIIYYDNRAKHHAIAIPEGEGRYVLNRQTGEVELVRGPKMFLPDPRMQVIVRRILNEAAVSVLYPGNREAIEVNRTFMNELALSADKQYLRAQGFGDESPDEGLSTTRLRGYASERTDRGTTYTPPRTLVLDTKYDGAVSVTVWPGYAVMVTKKTGERRVEVGPKVILLGYDESIATLSLSTGRPKSDERLFKTAYLQVVNNQVSDKIVVETSDFVTVELEVSYRVNFEGQGADRVKWFDVDNYVKLLTDHCRSRLRNAAKQHTIQDFYGGTIDIVRDALLGASADAVGRPGLAFRENSMRLHDIEVLNVTITDRQVEQRLAQAMTNALDRTIKLTEATRQAELDRELEKLKREGLKQRDRTARAEAESELSEVGRKLRRDLKKIASEIESGVEKAKVAAAERNERVRESEVANRLRAEQDHLAAERDRLETEQYVSRLQALNNSDLVEALKRMGDEAFMQSVIDNLGPAAMAAGVTVADLLSQLFKDSPYEGVMQQLAQRPMAGRRGSRK